MVAGKLESIDLMERTLEKGADLLAVGRLAIANSDLAKNWQADRNAQPTLPPWNREQLEQAGVSTPFWNYLGRRFADLIAKHKDV